jgi:uncharacterized membrane protein
MEINRLVWLLVNVLQVIDYNGFLPYCPHVSIVLKEEYLVKILLHIFIHVLVYFYQVESIILNISKNIDVRKI